MIVTDSFTRADSAVSLGTSDSGHAWTAHGATWGVASGRGYQAVADGTYHAASVNASVADGKVQATLAASAIGGICARLSDDSNFLHLEFGGANDFTLYKRVAGVFTSLGTFTATPAAGDVIALECRGTSLTAYLNGVARITATDAFNSSATRWGLSTQNITIRYDDFTVTA